MLRRLLVNPDFLVPPTVGDSEGWGGGRLLTELRLLSALAPPSSMILPSVLPVDPWPCEAAVCAGAAEVGWVPRVRSLPRRAPTVGFPPATSEGTTGVPSPEDWKDCWDEATCGVGTGRATSAWGGSARGGRRRHASADLVGGSLLHWSGLLRCSLRPHIAGLGVMPGGRRHGLDGGLHGSSHGCGNVGSHGVGSWVRPFASRLWDGRCLEGWLGHGHWCSLNGASMECWLDDCLGRQRHGGSTWRGVKAPKSWNVLHNLMSTRPDQIASDALMTLVCMMGPVCGCVCVCPPGGGGGQQEGGSDNQLAGHMLWHRCRGIPSAQVA